MLNINKLQCVFKINGEGRDLVNMKTYDEYFSWQKLITEIAEREDKKEKRTLIDVVWYLESLKNK